MDNLINLVSSGWIYFACSIYLLFLSEAYASFNFSKGVVFFSFALISVAALVASSLNTSYGYDREVYLEFYKSVAAYGWSGGYQLELLFRALLVAMYSAGVGFPLFMGIMTFVSLAIKFSAASCFKINPFCFCFALFSFFFLDLFFVRQLLAASIFFISVIMIERRDRSNLWWWVVMIAAIMIHASAILPIACYVGWSLRTRPIVLLGLLVCGCAIGAMSYNILLPKIFDQISVYSADDFTQVVDSTYSGFARNVFKNSILVLITYFCIFVADTSRQAIPIKTGKNIFAIVLLLAILSIILSSFLSPVFQRLSLYIFPFVALTLSSIYRPASLRTSIGVRTIALILVVYLLPILEGYNSLLI